MSIWNKVLIGLIIPCALVMGFQAVQVLRTQQYWQASYAQHLQALEKVHGETRNLIEAEKLPSGNLGTALAKRELETVLIGRGRVWHNCSPQFVDQQTGQVKLSVPSPDPHRITPNMLLYVMSGADVETGGRYLGEFRVDQLGERTTMAIVPTEKLDQEEIGQLVKSSLDKKAGWTLYEIMPVDNREVFANLDPETLKSLLPADSVPEYKKDGQAVKAEEVAAELRDRPGAVDGKGRYVRRLRDYLASFAYYRLERSLVADRCEAADRGKKYLVAATKDADLQRNFLQQEMDGLKADLKTAQGEVAAVTKHLAALTKKLKAVEDEVARTITENVALAKAIVRTQLDAARRIDERTRTIARGGAG